MLWLQRGMSDQGFEAQQGTVEMRAQSSGTLDIYCWAGLGWARFAALWVAGLLVPVLLFIGVGGFGVYGE